MARTRWMSGRDSGSSPWLPGTTVVASGSPRGGVNRTWTGPGQDRQPRTDFILSRALSASPAAAGGNRLLSRRLYPRSSPFLGAGSREAGAQATGEVQSDLLANR